MGYNAADAAYEAYAEEQYFESLRKEIIGEFKAGALQRVKARILHGSAVYKQIVDSELVLANELLVKAPPDHSGAFYHAYRASEAYLNSVVVAPIFEELMDPITSLFDSPIPTHLTIRPGFVKTLRNKLLARISDDEEISKELVALIKSFDDLSLIRNGAFHGFANPTEQNVKRCIELTQEIVALVESERLKITN